jgi:hypothetical protein
MNESKDPQEGSHMWTQDDMPSRHDIATINRKDGTEARILEIHAWDVDQTIAELPLMNQRSAYVTLFPFAKS